MAATGAAKAQLEKKALAADTKSAGMVILFEAGYSVSEVKEAMGVPYGFAYGVASRNGFVEGAANRRVAKAAPAKAAKATKATAAKAKAAAPARTRRAPARRPAKSKA